jgi:hypothetical protein
VGGPKAVNTYIAALRISGFHLQDSEAVLHHEVSAQYRNWFEPAGAVQLPRRISDNSPLTPEHYFGIHSRHLLPRLVDS